MSNIHIIRPHTRKREVLDMLKLHPNSTTKDLHSLMPHLDIDHISHAISSMMGKDVVFITGKKRETGPSGRTTTHRAYSAKQPKETSSKPQVKPQVKPQSELLNSLIKTLEAEVKMLQEWKQAALLRYPDLDVDPLLLEVRALLAAEAEEHGSKEVADAYISGHRDNSFAVRALVKALGGRK